VALEVAAQRGALGLAALGERPVALQPRNGGEVVEHRAQEEAQPHAFARSLDAHQVHAVVPVARAHQRQAVRAIAQAVLDRAHAMLVDARRFRRASRQVVVGVVLRIHRPALEEGDRFVENGEVARRLHVPRRRERQPEVVVRAARAHAAARRRMPPMLHVAFDELAARAAHQVLAHQRGLGVHQGHHVLQLVAEAERSAGLVVAAARPKAACHGLVQEPAVGEDVERGVRRAHLYSAERSAPLRVDRVERIAGGAGPAEALHEGGGLRGVAAHAEPEDDLALLAVGELEGDLHRPAGIERGAHPAREASARHRRRLAQGAVAAEELGAIAAHGAAAVVRVEECDASGELRVVGVARQQRAALRVHFRGEVHRRLRPQVAQHPLDVSRSPTSGACAPRCCAP
jgi:hypothetical protein